MNVRNTFKAFTCSLLEVFMAFPALYVILLLLGHSDQQRLCVVAAIIACGLLGIILGQVLEKKVWLIYVTGIVVCTAGSAFATLINGSIETDIPLIVCSTVMAVVVFHRGRMHALYKWNSVMQPLTVVYIIIANLAAMVGVRMAVALAPYHSIAAAVGLPVVIVNILVMNRLNIAEQVDKKNGEEGEGKLAVSKNMNTVNYAVLAAVIAGVVLVSSIKQIITVFEYIGKGIMWLLLKIIDLLPISTSEGMSESAGSNASSVVTETAEGNPFWDKVGEILMYIAVGAAILAVLSLLIYGIVRFVKFIADLFRRLSELRGERNSQNLGFYDVREKTLRLRDIPSQLAENLKKRLGELGKREKRRSELQTNEEKIRWLFRRVVTGEIRTGYEYKSSDTAAETLEKLQTRNPSQPTPELSSSYDAVRYGNRALDDGKVENLLDSF